MSPDSSLAEHPVIRDIKDFDPRSGTLVERAFFNNRLIVVLLCLLATLVLGYQAVGVRLNASFDKMIPATHPYIRNFFDNRQDLAGLGNSVRIAVEATGESIFDARYLETLRKLNDELFLLPGVDRPYMKSLWTPATRWVGVTEEGLDGGPVIPDNYDGSPASLEQVRENIERSGEIGQLVAGNYKSSIILVPLNEAGGAAERLDYHAFSSQLEALRTKYEAEGVRIHITGFSKIVGDLCTTSPTCGSRSITPTRRASPITSSP